MLVQKYIGRISQRRVLITITIEHRTHTRDLVVRLFPKAVHKPYNLIAVNSEANLIEADIVYLSS